MSERLPGIALFLARLYVGYWFLWAGLTKIGRGYLQGGALMPQLERFVAGTPHAWYKAWLVNIVLLLVVLVGGAGKYWGIDGWWRRGH